MGPRLHDDLHVSAECGKPTRQSIDRDTLHAPTEHLRKSRLIRSTKLRRFLLRQLAPRNRVFDGDDEMTLRHEFLGLGGCKADIRKYVTAAFPNWNFGHTQLSASSFCARCKRAAINSASGFGKAIPDLDFFMNTCST